MSSFIKEESIVFFRKVGTVSRFFFLSGKASVVQNSQKQLAGIPGCIKQIVIFEVFSSCPDAHCC